MNYESKVQITRKKTKNIRITIDDGLIYVVAPNNVDDDYIFSILKKKEKWISERILLNHFSVYDLMKAKDVQKIMYLGNEYEIVSTKGILNEVKILDNKIYVTYLDSVNSTLFEWFKLQGKELLICLCDKWSRKTNLNVNKIRVKLMRTRWGSCNHYKKYINLNLELLTKDEKFIDCVVLHEFAHLVYNNHSKDFYRYIESYIKDYNINMKR